jgi:hypothetical protein
VISVKSTFQWFGDKVKATVDDAIDRRLVAAGNQWLAQSRALAPVRTGRLRAEEDFQVADHTLILIMGAPYDVFTEFGTRYMMPRPHVRPALNAIGRLWGGNVEMQFNVAPIRSAPILAHPRPGVLFQTPRGLPAHQLQHVRQHLVPTSARLHRGHTKRAKMVVRRFD